MGLVGFGAIGHFLALNSHLLARFLAPAARDFLVAAAPAARIAASRLWAVLIQLLTCIGWLLAAAGTVVRSAFLARLSPISAFWFVFPRYSCLLVWDKDSSTPCLMSSAQKTSGERVRLCIRAHDATILSDQMTTPVFHRSWLRYDRAHYA